MDEDLNNLISKNKLVKNKKGIVLKDYYVDVLRRFDIDIDSCNSYQEILYFLDEIINNEDIDEDDYELLDEIAKEIAETNYYEYTNK